jgi:Arc/MetJ family transcription regulator
MKREYDFSRARRGAIVPPPGGKTRITIRIDDDVLDWFRAQVHSAGGGSYQTMMNGALREFMARREGALADALRHVLREELAPYLAKAKRGRTGRAKRRRTT